MAKITLTDITAGYDTATISAANNTLIENAIENTLSRDGTSPNQMESGLDMNSYRITNLPNAANNTEPVTLGQAASILDTTTATRDNLGELIWPVTDAETAAGVTPTNYYYEPGDVRRYGAVGDGVTDDTTAIQNAIDVMTTAGGGRVYIPEGTYLVSQDGANAHCLDLGGANNVDIVGESRTSTIIFTEASTGSSVRTFSTLSSAVDGLAIRSLTVDGNKANNGVDEQRHGIFLSSATNVLVDDVLSKNCTGDGLYLHSGTQYVVVRNCYFTDNERNGMTVGGTGPSDVTVEGCFIYDNDAQAFDSEATGVEAVLDNYTISGCRLESTALPVSMGGVDDREGVGWRLTNNFIKATGDKAIRCIYAKDAVIANNHIEVAAGGYSGVEVYSLNTNVIVSNNYILSPNTGGTVGSITVTGTSDANRSDRVTITGNIVETTGGTGQNGIRCNGSPRHLNVNGNQFIGDGGTGGGIVIRSTYALDTVSITGNTLVNTGIYGIQIVSNAQDIELVNISGNSIYDDQAVATVVDAIRFDLVGTITEVVCNNNASSSTITDHVHGLAGLNIVSGHYGTDPIVQPSDTGETVGFTAGAGTAVNDDSTFTGNVGSTAYRVSDIVKALKNLGLMDS